MSAGRVVGEGPGPVRRPPLRRWKLACRVAAEAGVLLVVFWLLAEYARSRRAQEWGHEADLYQALVVVAIGLIGVWLPRTAGTIILLLGGGFGLIALLWTGFALEGWAFVAYPTIVALLFFWSAPPRTQRRMAKAREWLER